MIGTSTHLEWFLLKRKLMGPCWLRIKPDVNLRKSSEALEVRFESVQVQARLDARRRVPSLFPA